MFFSEKTNALTLNLIIIAKKVKKAYCVVNQ